MGDHCVYEARERARGGFWASWCRTHQRWAEDCATARDPLPRRKYSIDEIDRMRAALRELEIPVKGYYVRPDELFMSHPEMMRRSALMVQDIHMGQANTTEERLRTHMLNGTEPEELEAKVAELHHAREAEQAEEARRDEMRRTNTMLREVFKDALSEEAQSRQFFEGPQWRLP